MDGDALKICAFSDTHGLHNFLQVPECDILICCGDFCPYGTMQDVIKFNAWLGKQPATHKICIAGNHDRWTDGNIEMTKAMFTNAIYLDNAYTELEGLKIWGSPITPSFGGWSHMRERGEEMAEVWSHIPEELDILITHGPIYGLLDKNVDGENCGCYDLVEVLETRSVKYHLFGHIHEARGLALANHNGKHTTTHVNCSVLNEYYKLVHQPYIWEFKK